MAEEPLAEAAKNRKKPLDLRPCTDFVRWDTTRLPLRSGSVDAISTDMPFGVRCGKSADNTALYPLVLQELER
jgi:tRNA G10  N-methylase Trm11